MTIQISTVQELQDILNDLTGDYELINNIDASDTINWNEGAGFQPIGKIREGSPFTGTFNGNGFIISGLYIYRPEYYDWSCGLFGDIDSATIQKVILHGANITGEGEIGHHVGSLIGRASNESTIIQCGSTGYVGTVGGSGGGLIGVLSESSISECYSECEVESISGSLGGLIANAYRSQVSNCYATGNPTGWATYYHYGGLVGINQGTDVIKCYATGNIYVANYAGGLIGKITTDYSYTSEIYNCFATGNVQGINYLGGFAGYKDGSDTVSDCYFVDDSDNGIGEYEDGGYLVFYGNSHSVYSTWDFDLIWENYNNEFPHLRWENYYTNKVKDFNLAHGFDRLGGNFQ